MRRGALHGTGRRRSPRHAALCHDRVIARTIYSVGHSNLTEEAFFALLATVPIARLEDVRAFPGSRRHPHFGRDALVASCRAHGVAYRSLPELGGRRRAPATPSPHVAWTVPAFRHYADYMDTRAFAAALAALAAEADSAATAFMCAEALWWQCHRRLIADRLVVAGWEVRHLGAGGRLAAHRLPEFARCEGEGLIYDRGVTLPLATRSTSRRRPAARDGAAGRPPARRLRRPRGGR